MPDPAPAPAQMPDAPVAPNTAFNLLRPAPVGFTGVLLWPSWADAPGGAPAAQVASTGTIQHHYHYTPGVLNVAANPVGWTTPEVITQAAYNYDKMFVGTPLPNVEVDLYHANADVDFNNFDLFADFYRNDEQDDVRPKALKIRFTKVDVLNDEDWAGKGELFFTGKIDGTSIGESNKVKGGSGETNLPLEWDGGGVVEVEVLRRNAPITLVFSGYDKDVFEKEDLGEVTEFIAAPWVTQKTEGSAKNNHYVVYWEIEPVASTPEERSDTPPTPNAEQSVSEKLQAAWVDSQRTDASGAFRFDKIRPGEYALFLRGRFSFVENLSPGGVVAANPAAQHNSVRVTPLAALQANPRFYLKVRVNGDGSVVTQAVQGNATVPFATERLLASGQVLADITSETPYRFYALPLIAQSNTRQWTDCAEELRRAFKVSVEQARATMMATPLFDLNALVNWECADPDSGQTQVIAPGVTTDSLMKQTLLTESLSGGDVRAMAYDHAYWHFSLWDSQTKSRGRFIPLDETGFFFGANALYALANKTKDTYGRFALRHLPTANLDGADVKELKTRLILWGSNTRFVDLRDDAFNQAVREALLRFKQYHQVYYKRVNGANGAPDPAQSVLTTIVDADAYSALDAAIPSLTLNDLADRDDINNPGIPLFNPEGYARFVFYAAEITRQRIAPQNAIRPHSSFRTLAHNRRVYLDNNNLRWRLATGAAAAPFTYAGITTVVGGVTGANGSNHNAGASVTAATIRYNEPRGTYTSNGGSDFQAPDYSKHTRGGAIDFCLDRAHDNNHAGTIPQVQRDTNAIVLFGATRGNTTPGRLWLEPQQPPGGGFGTTTWIHLDYGGVPLNRVEYVLTDQDMLGPRWDANLIVRGRVMSGGNPRLGAKVRLIHDGTVVAETYSDPSGQYSLRVQAGEVMPLGFGYQVEAVFEQPYPFQPPNPVGRSPLTIQDGFRLFAGDEVSLPDVTV